MSLADWTGLTASIGGWLKRGDHTSIAPDLLALAEQDFNDELRAREMVQETSLVITSGYLAHPSDWLAWKQIEVTVAGTTYKISPESEENASDRAAGTASSQPFQYVVRGGKTYIKPAPDSSSYAYPVVYYQKIPALSAAQTTNSILTRYPGLYLYGALSHAKAYLEEATWEYFETKKNENIEKINKHAKWSSYGNQALQMKVDIPVR